MKMEGRLLGLSLVIFVFAIVETSAQNFYPTRYGKRDGKATDGPWPRGSQYERRSELSGNLFFGSRYGKRSYNTTPSESLTESMAPAGGDRYGRSSDTANTDDRFFFGSRFGKRNPSSSSDAGSRVPVESKHFRSEEANQEYLVCRYTGFPYLYHCLKEMEDDKVAEKGL